MSFFKRIGSPDKKSSETWSFTTGSFNSGRSSSTAVVMSTTTESSLPGRVEYMKKHIQLCQYFSMWPVGNISKSRLYIHNLSFWAVTTALSLLLFPLLFKIFSDFRDMDGIATVIDFATVNASGIFRYVYIYFRAAKYSEMIEFMNNNFVYESFFPAKNKINMGKYIKMGTIIGALYFGVAYIWILQMCFGPLIAWHILPHETNSTKMPLVFEASYPFDITTQPTHGLVYFFQVIGFLSLGYVYLLIDAFWYMIIILAIGQFDLINYSLKNTMTIIEEYEEEEAEEKVVEGVKMCIRQHQLTREFIHIVENVLSPNVLVDFLHAVLSITFILLDMTIALNEGDWMKTFHLFEYFTVSIVHMFLFDWLGNELVLREEQLVNSIYDIPWLTYSKQLKPSVIAVTIQARHPYKLTGGKFYDMCLPFFVATVKTIFSYFTVLLQLRNDTT